MSLLHQKILCLVLHITFFLTLVSQKWHKIYIFIHIVYPQLLSMTLRLDLNTSVWLRGAGLYVHQAMAFYF